MPDNESDPPAGGAAPEASAPPAPAAPAAPDNARPAGLGDALIAELRDHAHVLAALRALVAGDDGDPESARSRALLARGERLRRARELKGLSRVALARMIGEHHQTIEKVERGMVRRTGILPKLTAALGLAPDGCAAAAAPCAPPPLAGRSDAGAPGAPGAADPALGAHELRGRLDADYELFAARELRIRGKRGAMAPLVFNRAQRHIHAALEAQKAATGKVRALVLKGRQQGCSTYVAGRYYHRASRAAGLRVFILSHEEQASRNLFEIVARFHDLVAPELRPSTGVANASELYFDALDSGYKVATAGTRGVGRSATLQLFHGSEVAFWPHADTHAAGVLQAVADLPGTEIILELTAHGVGNLFHKLWRDAEAGLSGYVAIFVPWFWQEEYRQPPPENFALDAEEAEYAALHRLDPAQMAWRRAKIVELNDPLLFKQEYPATAAEAFQMSGHDSFIPPELIARARKARCEPSGPLIIGYDPAWTGGDRHAMAWRRGRVVLKVETRLKLDTVQAAGWVKRVIDADRPAKVFIDIGNAGAGVYDQLKHMGPPYSHIVEAVNFGSAPFEPPPRDELGRPMGGPLNRRAEIWLKSKEWLELEGGVQVPDSDSLQADACGPGYRWDMLTRLVLEAKEDMRRRGALSPDQWDAVALTFARPVAPSNFNRKIVYPPSGLV